MNVRQHAFLARALQDANGGVDACLNLLEPTAFAMGRTHMYACRDPGSGRTMPIGAVVFLERACRARPYTAVICAEAPEPTDADCAVSEVCELNETGAFLQRLVRKAAEDGEFTENEKREIEPVLQAVERHARNLRKAMDAPFDRGTVS